MIVFWIILGIVLWITPIVIIFWSMKQVLLSKGRKATLGTIHDLYESECLILAFVPVINLFMSIVFGLEGVFNKYKDVEL